MKKALTVIPFALALALAMAIPSHAQSTTPITVGQSTGRCQQTNTTLNCYSVAMTIGTNSGTAWVYPQGQSGFILFRPNLEGTGYVEATVTSSMVTGRNSVGQVTQLTVTYTLNGDPNSDGDTDVIMGSIVFNIVQGVGRYGYPSVTSGSGQQSIALN
jgi:hypothetical protein